MLNRFRSDRTPRAAPPTAESRALEGVNTWSRTVNSRQPTALSRLYSDDAIFLPTLHHGLIQNRIARTDYFSKLLGRSGFSVRIMRVQTQTLGADAAICSGLYEFGYFDQGQMQWIEARFTMVFRDIGGQFLIVNHHSSRTP